MGGGIACWGWFSRKWGGDGLRVQTRRPARFVDLLAQGDSFGGGFPEFGAGPDPRVGGIGPDLPLGENPVVAVAAADQDLGADRDRFAASRGFPVLEEGGELQGIEFAAAPQAVLQVAFHRELVAFGDLQRGLERVVVGSDHFEGCQVIEVGGVGGVVEVLEELAKLLGLMEVVVAVVIT